MRAYARTVPFEGESIQQFLKGFRTEATKDGYSRKLRHFLEFTKISPDEFLARTKQDPRWAERLIIDYVEARKQTVTGATIITVRDALKHFYEMNDYYNGINWPKIVKMMPKTRKVGSDRAPTVDEVRRMVESADLRLRCAILLLSSTGIRVGAVDTLTWGDVQAVLAGNEVAAAKLTVYRGDAEEYQALMTPECYAALLEYKERRMTIGEQVTPSSPLLRDNWDGYRYRLHKHDPRIAAPMTSLTVRNLVRELLWQVGLRRKEGKQDFKQVHGFRKFFKTQAERVMKTIDVERLLGHTENYYKPSPDYLTQEYRKAVPYLTISEGAALKDQLQAKTENQEKKIGELEIMNLKLQEKLIEMEGKIKELTEFVVGRKVQLSKIRTLDR
jgi:integrase